MAYNPEQFRDLIGRTLNRVRLELDDRGDGIDSEAAVNLLLGTAAVESAFGTFLRQIEGPALGAFQMEQRTFEWVCSMWEGLLPEMAKWEFPELEYDLRKAIISARMYYRLKREPLPKAEDWARMALYWKQHYNTLRGKGTANGFLRRCQKYLGIEL